MVQEFEYSIMYNGEDNEDVGAETITVIVTDTDDYIDTDEEPVVHIDGNDANDHLPSEALEAAARIRADQYADDNMSFYGAVYYDINLVDAH